MADSASKTRAGAKRARTTSTSAAPAPAFPYRARAECAADAYKLYEQLTLPEFGVRLFLLRPDAGGLPDVDIEFALAKGAEPRGGFDMLLERVRAWARAQPDMHVVEETLAPAAAYTGARNSLAGTCAQCEHYVVLSGDDGNVGACDCAGPRPCRD